MLVFEGYMRFLLVNKWPGPGGFETRPYASRKLLDFLDKKRAGIDARSKVLNFLVDLLQKTYDKYSRKFRLRVG
jgi:hypothetical protein